VLASKQKSFFHFLILTGFRDFALRPYAKKKSSATLLYAVSTLPDSAIARDTVHSHAK